jgi:YggT family protein
MSILGNFLSAVITVLDLLLNIYMWIIVARAIISWVSPNPYNPIVNFLYIATEPVLKYVRRIIPPIGGTLDLSPIVVLVVIVFLRRFLILSLMQLVSRL